jgi:hypothetical protein
MRYDAVLRQVDWLSAGNLTVRFTQRRTYEHHSSIREIFKISGRSGNAYTDLSTVAILVAGDPLSDETVSALYEAPAYPIAGWHWTPEGNALVAKKYLALFAEIGIPSDPMQSSSEPTPPVRNDAAGRQFITMFPSVLSPSIWLAAAQVLPGELISLGRYLQRWSIAVHDSHGWPRVGVTLLVLTVLAIAMAMLWFWGQRRATVAADTSSRSSKALSSFGIFLCLAFATPLLTITLLEATEVRMIEISYGFIVGIAIASFGRARSICTKAWGGCAALVRRHGRRRKGRVAVVRGGTTCTTSWTTSCVSRPGIGPSSAARVRSRLARLL